MAGLVTGIGALANNAVDGGFPFISKTRIHVEKPRPFESPESIQPIVENIKGDEHEGQISTKNKQITDEVLFDMFFIKVFSLQNAARKAQARGESGKLWSEYLSRSGFTEQEVSVIKQIASEHAANIAPIHARAMRIIKEARTSLRNGQPLPPPPAELKKFQQERYSVTLNNREKLRARLGAATVEKARELMRSGASELQIDPANIGSQYRLDQFRRKMNSTTREGKNND